MKKYLAFASIGFELIGLLLVGIYFGEFLDKKYAGGGIYQSSLVVLALFGWMARLLINLKKYNKPE